MKALSALAAALLAALLASPPAVAVDNAVPDRDRHPNVGLLGFDFDAEGESPPFFLCSGSVISDRVFLTAAHCIDVFGDEVQWVASLAPGGPEDPIYVPGFVFDDFPMAVTAPVHRPLATIVHPRFEPDTLAHDLAVLVFPPATFGVQPVELPPLRLLERIGLRTPHPAPGFTLVGYGVDPDYGVGEPRFFARGFRQTATASFAALTPTQLHLQGAGVSGQGGLCLGDSGSPQFLGSSNVAVSQLPAVGDACREIVSQRLDTQAERRFLARFVDLS